MKVPALNSRAYHVKCEMRDGHRTVQQWGCSAPQSEPTQIVNPAPNLESHYTSELYWHPYTSIKRPCQMSFSWLSFGRYNAGAEIDYSLTTSIYGTCVMQVTAELAENLRQPLYFSVTDLARI